jgi:hypothetical protein
MIKKFLVQIESDADTRWLKEDNLVAEEIKAAARLVAELDTTGRVPKVTVLRDEIPVPHMTLAEHNAYPKGRW